MLNNLIIHSKEKAHYLLQKKITTLSLILTLIIIVVSKKYYLTPYIEKKEDERVSYLAKKMQERYEMKPRDFVRILNSLALTTHIGVWIDSVLIEDNKVMLDIKSLDSKSMNEYIALLIKNSKLVLEGVSTSAVKKMSKKNDKTEEGEIPMAYARFLKMTKNQKKPDNKEKENSLEYFYTSKVILSRKKVL